MKRLEEHNRLLLTRNEEVERDHRVVAGLRRRMRGDRHPSRLKHAHAAKEVVHLLQLILALLLKQLNKAATAEAAHHLGVVRVGRVLPHRVTDDLGERHDDLLNRNSELAL